MSTAVADVAQSRLQTDKDVSACIKDGKDVIQTTCSLLWAALQHVIVALERYMVS